MLDKNQWLAIGLVSGFAYILGKDKKSFEAEGGRWGKGNFKLSNSEITQLLLYEKWKCSNCDNSIKNKQNIPFSEEEKNDITWTIFAPEYDLQNYDDINIVTKGIRGTKGNVVKLEDGTLNFDNLQVLCNGCGQRKKIGRAVTLSFRTSKENKEWLKSLAKDKNKGMAEIMNDIVYEYRNNYEEESFEANEYSYYHRKKAERAWRKNYEESGILQDREKWNELYDSFDKYKSQGFSKGQSMVKSMKEMGIYNQLMQGVNVDAFLDHYSAESFEAPKGHKFTPFKDSQSGERMNMRINSHDMKKFDNLKPYPNTIIVKNLKDGKRYKIRKPQEGKGADVVEQLDAESFEAEKDSHYYEFYYEMLDSNGESMDYYVWSSPKGISYTKAKKLAKNHAKQVAEKGVEPYSPKPNKRVSKIKFYSVSMMNKSGARGNYKIQEEYSPDKYPLEINLSAESFEAEDTNDETVYIISGMWGNIIGTKKQLIKFTNKVKTITGLDDVLTKKGVKLLLDSGMNILDIIRLKKSGFIREVKKISPDYTKSDTFKEENPWFPADVWPTIKILNDLKKPITIFDEISYRAESFDAEERWYLSDPCYAIPDDRWDEFVDKLLEHPNYDKNKRMDIEWEVDGEDYIVEVWDSPGGDGVWSFSVGEFGVDAGVLAVIPEKVAMEGGKPFDGQWFDKKPTLFTDNRNYIVEINGERNQEFDAESFE